MTDAMVSELLAKMDATIDCDHEVSVLWPETRAVIEAAVQLMGERSECTCGLCRALAAWRKRAKEVLA